VQEARPTTAHKVQEATTSTAACTAGARTDGSSTPSHITLPCTRPGRTYLAELADKGKEIVKMFITNTIGCIEII
jgi:hypothetical protein